MENSEKTINLNKWRISSSNENDGRVTKYVVFEDEKIMKFPQVFHYWKTSEDFRIFYNNILASSVYEAFFWEIPPTDKNWQDKEFEFVLVSSNALSRIQPNKSPFQKYFKTTDPIVTFPNLGGDAQLIVPTPISEDENYPHFAKFIRNAPFEQKNQIWKILAEEYEKRLGDRPQWLSTSGLGVYWLHLRIDSRPKYYQYHPYRSF